MAKTRYSYQADLDVIDILAFTYEEFGSDAHYRYQELIRIAISDVSNNPYRIGSRTHSHLERWVRLYNLSGSVGHLVPALRVKHPRHFLAYRVEEDGAVVAIGRVLHDRMNPQLHLPPEVWE